MVFHWRLFNRHWLDEPTPGEVASKTPIYATHRVTWPPQNGGQHLVYLAHGLGGFFRAVMLKRVAGEIPVRYPNSPGLAHTPYSAPQCYARLFVMAWPDYVLP